MIPPILLIVVAGAGIAATVAAWFYRAQAAEATERLAELERRVQAAEERRAADRVSHIRRILDALPLGVAVLRGSEVVAANANAAAPLRNPPALALLGARMRAIAAQAMAGDPHGEPLDLFGPPAKSYWIAASSIAGIGDDSRPMAVVTVKDITELVRTEAVRRDFVANISHELKTPVGAIGLLAETLEDETDREVIDRLARQIVRELERLNATIDDLLELAAIEFGQVDVSQPVELAAVAREVLERLDGVAELAGIELRLRVDDEHVAVGGEPRELASALFNLVENAIKYTDTESAGPERPVVEIHIRRIDAAERDALVRADPTAVVDSEGDVGPVIMDDAVAVTVRDEGIGIPSAHVDRVFERFYRVDRARSRKTGGTGLGLAIVRHIVRHHGGTITADSVEGLGSAFTFVLPLHRPPSVDEGVEDGSEEPSDG